MAAVNSRQVVLNISMIKERMAKARVKAKGKRVSFVDVIAEKKITHVGESGWTA